MSASRKMRRRCRPGSGTARLYLSILLIIAGLLLFLGNLGLFPLHNIFELWPLVLVALGLGRWSDKVDPVNRLWAAMLIGFGAIFFCTSMGFLRFRSHDGSWLIAIGLIVFGVFALSRSFEPPRLHRNSVGEVSMDVGGADILADSAVLGSVQRRVESLNFQGGALNCVMGSIELDLRRAQVLNPHQPITIETNCIMGSIKLRLPETWRVSIVGVPVMGSYEDRTVPISRPDFMTGTLIVSGSCVMGQVEIES